MQMTFAAVGAVILLVIIILLAVAEAAMKRRGDCDLCFDKERAGDFRFYKDDQKLQYSFTIPVVNKGQQQGLLIDCHARIQAEGDIFKYMDVKGRIVNCDNPRLDDYWEGNIILAGKECKAEVSITILSPKEDHERIRALFSSFFVDIMFKFYGRNLMTYSRCTVPVDSSRCVSAEESLEERIGKNVKAAAGKSAVIPSNVIPIKTHLLRPHEDMAEIIRKYADGKAVNGDILTIAESAVAILQGRVYYVEDIKPRFLAQKINKLFKKDSSLSSPYSLEMGFQEAGVFRILLATVLGVLGRAIGRQGDFYRVAGKNVAVIDDCTGTLPPFDKYVVMGPADLNGVVSSIKEKTGLEAAIVDVNDLRRVDILALTCPEHREYLEKALVENPAGNANEQTPIVLVKAPSKE